MTPLEMHYVLLYLAESVFEADGTEYVMSHERDWTEEDLLGGGTVWSFWSRWQETISAPSFDMLMESTCRGQKIKDIIARISWEESCSIALLDHPSVEEMEEFVARNDP